MAKTFKITRMSVTPGQESAKVGNRSSEIIGPSGAQLVHDHAGQLIRPRVLILPQAEPLDIDLREGEYALYLTEQGEGAETPASGTNTGNYIPYYEKESFDCNEARESCIVKVKEPNKLVNSWMNYAPGVILTLAVDALSTIQLAFTPYGRVAVRTSYGGWQAWEEVQIGNSSGGGGGGGGTTAPIDVDSALSSTSTNPVQNKVIYSELQKCVKKVVVNGTEYNVDENGVVSFNIQTGGGGTVIYETVDYDKLNNKPEIEGVELSGNKTFKDLGLDLSKYYHTDNANLLTIDWQAKKLTSKTLVIPTSAPGDIEPGEYALYITEQGEGAETPGLPEEWLNSYYTKSEIDTKLTMLRNAINALTDRIEQLENNQ